MNEQKLELVKKYFTKVTSRQLNLETWNRLEIRN